MTDRLPCSACGTAILLSTAEKNGGLCMPCKGGYRKNIEESKVRHEQDKKYRAGAEHKHWLWLVSQASVGFDNLSHPNKLFFAINLVSGEVYNGGFDQYFHNSSANYFNFAVEGLVAIGASESLRLLMSAKQVLFGDSGVPSNTGDRRNTLRSANEERQENQAKELELLDKSFWADPDKLSDRMTQFAQLHGLHRNF